ncbi:DUF1189 family protein [Candidatus Woesearchaeota archaeon]|nr:DUF1189 family protein [Candidatus Woesearchaeota archaeon]
MKSREFVLILLRSFNPDNYKSLKKLPSKRAFDYFFILLLFSSLVFGLLWLIKLSSISGEIDEKFSQFNKFNISLDVKMKAPVILSKFPLVVLDLTGNRTGIGKEYILITEDFVFRKRISPDIGKFTIFKTDKQDIDNYADLLANKDLFKTLTGVLIIILLPTLFFAAYFYFIIKYLIIIFMVSFLAYAFTRLTRKKLKKREILKTALFSSTFMIVPEMVLKNFINMYFLPLVIYLIFFIVCIYMSSEKSFEVKSRHKKKEHDIFDRFR